MRRSKLKILIAIFAVALVAAMSLVMFAACNSTQEIVEKCIVTFMNGDEVFDTQHVTLGEKYELPEGIPAQEQPDDEHELQFVGWTLDANYYEYRSEIIEEPDFVVADITIYAAFRKVAIADTPEQGANKEYEVEFRMPVGEEFGEYSGITIDKQTVKRYGNAKLPSDDMMPQITGYHFTGEWTGGTLTDVRGRRRVTAVYEKNIYTLTLHYLDKSEERKIEYLAPVDLTEEPQVDEAFIFDGWYDDAQFGTKATLTKMPDGDVHIYAKHHVDFSTASVSKEGTMVYGDAANKLYVSGLKDCDGLEYTFDWIVNGEKKPTTSERNYGLREVGTYNVKLHIYANYKNNALTDQAYAYTAQHTQDFVFAIQKATLTAVVTLDASSIVYGNAAPGASIVYSGFVFDETQESAHIAQRFVYMQGESDVTGQNLHVGNYRVDTFPQEHPNYQYAPIDSPKFEVTRKTLNVTASANDHGYGDPLAFDIGFDGFVFEDDKDDLGEHWFALNGAAEKYVGGERLHAGEYSAQLQGYASSDYDVKLPQAFEFSVSKRAGGVKLAAVGGIYGAIPAISVQFENVFPEDQARFTPVYSYRRGGDPYTSVNRFIVGNYTVTAKFVENGFEDYQTLVVTGTEFSISKKPLNVYVPVNDSYVYGDTIEKSLKYEEAFEFGEDEKTSGVISGNVRYIFRTASDGKAYDFPKYNVDDYTVEASGLTSANYDLKFPKKEFSVTKKGLTMGVHLEKDTILYGTSPRVAAATNYINGISYDGFVMGETARSVFGSDLPEVYYLDAQNERATQFHAGTYTATTSADPRNYSVTINSVELTVTRRTLCINVALPKPSMVYGNKPTATEIVYENETFDGFVSSAERDLYTASAYVKYAGKQNYTQAQLAAKDTKMVVDEYNVSVEGVSEDINNDYIVTYGYQKDGLKFSVTPAALSVTLSANRAIYTYGIQPNVTAKYEGFAYDETAQGLFGENANKILYRNSESNEQAEDHLVVGKYAATLNGIQNANYTVDLKEFLLTVEPKALTVRVSAESFTYGNKATPEPKLTFSEFAYDEDSSDLGGAAKFTYKRGANRNDEKIEYSGEFFDAGYYQVTVSGLESKNYSITYPVNSANDFTVSKRNFTATLNAKSNLTYGDDAEFGFTQNVLDRDKDGFDFKCVVTYRSGSTGSYAPYEAEKYSHYQAGNYQVVLDYKHNSNYNEISVSPVYFSIAKRAFTAKIDAQSITYGDEKNYSYKVDNILDKEDEASFKFNLVVKRRVGGAYEAYDESKYNYYQAGDYQLTLEYTLNSNYKNIDVQPVTFNVAKRAFTATITANGDITYGEDKEVQYTRTITGILSEDEKGFDFNLVLKYRKDSGTAYANYVEDSYTHYQAGQYQVVLEYNLNDNYKPLDKDPTKTFTVKKKQLTASITAHDITYGEAKNYSYEVGNIVDEADRASFKFNLAVERLIGGVYSEYSESEYDYYQAGNYRLTLKYTSNPNYINADVKPSTFNVAKRAFTASINAQNITYGDAKNYSYKVDNILDADMASFQFDLVVERLIGGTYRKYEEDAYAHYQAGDYQLTLEYKLNSNYNDISVEPVTFNVAKRTFTATIIANEDITYGEDKVNYNYQTDGILSGEESGFHFNLVLKYRKNSGAVYAEYAKDSYTHYQAGQYQVVLEYTLDPNYKELAEKPTKTFNVLQKQLTVTVKADDITYGETPNPSISNDGLVTGDEELLASPKYSYTKGRYERGIFHAGAYTVTVEGISSNNYNVTIESCDFTVKQAPITVTVNSAGYTYGERFSPSVSLTYGKFVHSDKESDLGNPSYTYKRSALQNGDKTDYTESGRFKAGYYTIGVSGLMSDDYDITVKTKDIVIQKAKLTVTVSANGFKYDGKSKPAPQLSFVGFKNSENSDVLSGEPVYHYVGNVQEEVYHEGTYTVSVDGYTSENYEITYQNGNFTVSPREVTLRFNSVWSTYADDPQEYKWYTLGGDSILGEELKFEVSIKKGGENYTQGSEKFFSVGSYVVTVSYNTNHDYVVKHNNDALDGSVSGEEFAIGKKQLTLTISDNTQWAERESWAVTPKINDSRFTLKGFIELNNKKETEAGTYTSDNGGLGNHFVWKEGNYSITINGVDGVDVKDNFELNFIINITLNDSQFTVQVPQDTEFTYDGKPHSFKVTATADDISADAIKYSYSTTKEGEYQSEPIEFTNWQDGGYTVYYKVSADNAKESSGLFTVTVKKASLSVSTIDGVSATYDGNNKFKQVTKDDVQGLINDDDITVTYSRTQKGVYGEAWEIKNATNSGAETVWFKASAGDNYTEASGSYTVTIAKATVDVPTLVRATYKKGETQTANVPDGKGLYTVETNNGGTVVGGYDVVLKLNDADNYKWSDNTVGAVKTLKFYIDKATVTRPTADKTETFTYNKSSQTYKPTDFDEETMDISGNEQTYASSYTVIVSLKDKRNYKWEEGEEDDDIEFTFVINKALVTRPTENKNTFTYNANPQTYMPVDFKEETMNISNNTQTPAKEDGYKVTVWLKDNDNYKWATGSENDTIEFTFVINKATVARPTADKTETFTYNAQPQTYNPTGFDEKTMKISDNTQTNANSYTVTVSLKDKNNYKWADGNAEDSTFSFVIGKSDKATINTSAIITSYDYTGKKQTIAGEAVAKGIGEDETGLGTISYSNNSFTNVPNGGTFELTVTLSDGTNYFGKTATVTITVNKANYQVTVKEKQTHTYNASAFGTGVTFAGVNGEESPAGAAVTYDYHGVIDPKAVPQFTDWQDGGYTVTYTISGNSNYNDKSGRYTITINKATPTLTNATDESSYTYGGALPQLTEDGILNAVKAIANGNVYDKDAITITMSKDDTKIEAETINELLAKISDAGKYVITISVSGDNYNDATASYTVTISPKKLTAKLSANSVSGGYDGSTKYGKDVQVSLEDETVALKDIATVNYTYEAEGNGYTNYNGSTAPTFINAITNLSVTVTVKLNSGNYTFGESNTFTDTYTVNISKANITFTAPTDASGTYEPDKNWFKAVGNIHGVDGDSNFNYTVEYGKSKNAYGKDPLTITNVADSCTVYYKISAGDNYNEATGDYTVTISPKRLTVMLPNNIDDTYKGQGTKYSGAATLKDGGDNLDKVPSEIVIKYSHLSAGSYEALDGATEAPVFCNAVDNLTVTVNIECKSGNYEFFIKDGEYNSSYKSQYKVNIAKKTLSLNDIGFELLEVVYNKGNHFIDLKDLVTGLLEEEKSLLHVEYSFSADKDYQEAALNLVNAGSHTVYYKISAGDNYTEPTGSYAVTIAKATVQVPTIKNKTYNKANQVADITSNTDYDVTTNEGGTDANADGYDVVLTLKDADNYKWSDNTVGAVKTLKFYIDKATVTRPTANETAFTYNAQPQTYNPKGFEGDTMTISDNHVQTNAGSYEVSVSLADSNNYKWSDDKAEDSTFTFTIAKADYQDVKVEGDLIYTYNAQPQGGGIKITFAGVDGEASPKNATVKYSYAGQGDADKSKVPQFTNYQNGGYIVTYTISGDTNYNDKEDTYTITINKATPKVDFPKVIDPSLAEQGISVQNKGGDQKYLQGTYNAGNQSENFAKALAYIDKYSDAKVEYALETVQPGGISLAGDLVWTTEISQIILTAAGSYQLSVRISGANYDEVEKRFDITINKAILKVAVKNVTKRYDNLNGFQKVEESNITGLFDGDDITVTYSFNKEGEYKEYNEDAFKIISATNNGPVTVWYKVDAGDNYTVVYGNASANNEYGSYTVAINKATLTELPGGVVAPSVEDEVVCRPGRTLATVCPLGEHWSWAKGVEANIDLTAGEHRYTAQYTDPSGNYEPYDVTVTFNARKEKITVTFVDYDCLAVIFGATVNQDGAIALSNVTGISCTGEGNRSLPANELAIIYVKITNGGFNIKIGSTYQSTVEVLDNDYFEMQSATKESVIIKIKTVYVGGTLYTIEDALNAAQSGQTVTVKNDTSFADKSIATEAGYKDDAYYTVKNGVTLLLPYDGGTGLNATTTSGKTSAFNTAFKKLELTIGENITLYNNGTISIGGITTGQQGGYSGCTAGDFAQITMGTNAVINSIGDINAYGYIAETAENNGSQVIMNSGTLLMPFIVIEHRGGTQFVDMIGGRSKASDPDLKTSPFNSFYLQNVMAKLTVCSTAKVLGHANLYAANSDHITDINLVGNSDSLINLEPGTKLVIKYHSDSVLDSVLDLEIKGSAKINELSLTLTISAVIFSVTAQLTTKKVHFPISWHFNVTLSPYEDGGAATVDATAQKIKLLPGAKLTVSKDVTLNLDELVVYDNTSIADITDPAHDYEKKKENATLIVNGKLTAKNLAGVVQTTQDGAVVNVTGSNIITTQELSENTPYKQTEVLTSDKGHGSKYKTITTTFKGKQNGGSTATEMSAGMYVSNNSSWEVADQTFNVSYQFKLRNEDGTIVEFNESGFTNDNITEYNLQNSYPLNVLALDGYTFLGWYTNAECGAEYKIEQLVGYNFYGDIVLYGLFEKKSENNLYINYTLEKEGYDISKYAPLTLATKDIDTFDPFADEWLTRDDYNISFEKYFGGWQIIVGGSPVKTCNDIVTLREELKKLSGGTEVELKAIYLNKVKLTVNIKAKGRKALVGGTTISLTATITASPQTGQNATKEIKSEGAGLIGSVKEVSDSLTAYLKPGQDYTVEGISNGTVTYSGNPSGTAGDGDITVTISAT